ncbi:MAG: 4Fe-4S dicluster domain-containing protein [Bryobacteraceae bacterium]|nr:4Fe-4S dicluster domain-containing protein [Bryobacteraceae bacterium]
MIRKNAEGKHARYGMLIDLDRCDGCGACMVACAVENNIPPGRPGANARTGLNWIKVHRIETGGRPAFLPIMCQQCEDETPCVEVCPQNAVELDPATGVVGQIPQRCLGCRYCVTACPYHARVFNWGDPEWPAGMEKTLNPLVSPRMRGVVEKCNFCHGRWHAAREKAAADGSTGNGPVNYVPACVEACPAGAMAFGDLNDPDSALTRAVAAGEAFRLLDLLQTGPKTFYKTAFAAVRKGVAGERDA